jgi:folate-binding protein YgfZ
MKKDQITILEDRGLISISGIDAKDFLQNILTNDIEKVSESSSIFSAIFTPQGKYLYEFFVIKSENSYLLDCDKEFTNEIVAYLSRYKLRSKIEIADYSDNYAVGIISLNKFQEIKTNENKNCNTIIYQESFIFMDTRNKKLGVRILTKIQKLYLIVKQLKLNIVNIDNYLRQAYLCGIPIKGVRYLKDKLFGLEANFEELNAIDFKKGCYVGQENTARMKLKNKIRRKLFSISSDKDLSINAEITFEDKVIGKILIDKPYSFALIKLFDPDIDNFINKDLKSNSANIKILKSL